MATSMDKHARVSKDLLEPGPTALEPEAVPVTTGMIVKNGQNYFILSTHTR